MDFKHFLIAAVLCGAVWAQSEPSISDALGQLPPELQGKVNESDIENIKNSSAALLKEKCEKNGGAEAFENAQKAYEKFPTCVKQSLGLEDPAVLQKEIEQAKPNGTVDEVFKKYCAKTPKVKECFMDMTEAVKPCFSVEEQQNLKIVYNISEQLAEFICYKDGDRIALFIAEGGPECFQEKQEQIQDCVNKTLGADYKINTENITANAIPQIKFGEKECKQMSDLQECIVGALEGCDAPTSGNIVESLFKFARQATPCKNEKKPNSANALSVASTAILFAVAATLY
ncbi:27 kDa hemolymph protein-like [Pectinophora gossypiella]|uniref:27 kDa hemolymph protein-like n=1 Tax=Pectinophora gossypiella TaxID=13191 RepID=UPI00214E2338|nr:27 kDa hemolymph protein-like [Pectinophora gossypiella]